MTLVISSDKRLRSKSATIQEIMPEIDHIIFIGENIHNYINGLFVAHVLLFVWTETARKLS